MPTLSSLVLVLLLHAATGFSAPPVGPRLAPRVGRTPALDAVAGGSYVALVTPFTENEEHAVDVAAFDALLEWHVAEGTDGLVVLGTTGEAATMTAEERATLIERSIAKVGGRVPVVIGTGTYNTRTSIDQTLEAMRAGADAALVVTPYYNKPPQAALVAHFTAIADAVVATAKAEGLPVMPLVLYNVPGRTGCDMKPDTVAELAQHEAICGIKDATGEIERLAELRAGCGPEFLLYVGEDALACPWTLQGGDGVISVTANVCPRTMADMIKAAAQGDAATAQALDKPLGLLHDRLFCQANPIPVKWALSRMGRIPSPAMRMPLLPLEPSFHDAMDEAIEAGNSK